MKQKTKLLTAAVVTSSALWAVQGAAAQTDANKAQMQNQINQLQQEVEQLKQQLPGDSQQAQSSETSSSDDSSFKVADPLTIGGGVVGVYGNNDWSKKTKPGGSINLDYFDLNVSGKTNNGFSYGADYRWSIKGVGFGGTNQWIHKGWGAYNFGPGESSQVKVGYFQVPFGNLPFGYTSFFAPLNYYLGLTDNQALGVGYKYEAGGLRFDIDYFRNDDFGQSATYGGNPRDSFTDDATGDKYGADVINKGDVRLGYTFNEGGDSNATISASFQGGQVYTEQNPSNRRIGSMVAGSVAAAANIASAVNGSWTLFANVEDYKYNIPKGAYAGSPDYRKAIPFQDYGFTYFVPAGGISYGASISRTFDVHWGPFTSVSIYDDYSYLSVNSGSKGGPNNPASNGDIQTNVAGINWVAGPLYLWTEVLTGRNATASFANNKDDGEWNTTFKMYLAFYFSGTFAHDD